MQMSRPLPPAPRAFGAVNWLGLWTLYAKEVRRFVKVATQTVLAPLVTTLLYLAIFVLAVGDAVHRIVRAHRLFGAHAEVDVHAQGRRRQTR